MKAAIFFILYIFLIKISVSQTFIDSFFQALINNQDNITNFVDPDELTRSSRLGINYTGIKNKFLISYDIEDSLKELIAGKKLEYKTNIAETDGDFSKIEFSIPPLNYSKVFYFKSGKYISPTTYYSRNWETDTSKYFIFKISDPAYFNKYCENKLDEFVDKMADKLQYTDEEKQLLQKEKIYYLLCKDAAEIKTISGFDMRGQYLTAFDEILTTYNTHYHELSHLLMNYKLKNLSLFTLPFFMEGFAVAMGGRGGLSTRVVTDIGLFLQVKGIISYDSILTNDDFYKEDASLTYPVSGLYTLLLMKTLGMDSYLELYKKVNGDLEYLKKIKLEDLNLPDKKEFKNYLKEYEKEKYINSEKCSYPKRHFMEEIYIDSCYSFETRDNFIYLYPISDSGNENYKSKIFNEVTKKTYNLEAYLIKVDTVSIKLYNCYSNELIASYDKNFCIDSFTEYFSKSLVIVDGIERPDLSYLHYFFNIAITVFDVPFNQKDLKNY